MTLTAIAVDDEPRALEIIRLHAAKVPFLELRKEFRDALQAIDWLHQNPVDLIFLDINMPDVSGLKFRELIGEEPMIIFTTAYSEFALESYRSDAVDYLVKPVSFDRFLKAGIRAKGRKYSSALPSSPKPDQADYLYIKSGRQLHKIEVGEVLFIEKDGNYVVFRTSGKKILTRLNMTQLLEMLPERKFLKVHKSYVVALKHIEVIDGYEVLIKGHRIPIAKSYREELLGKLKN